MKKIEINNGVNAKIKLSYNDYGSGKPVVLIHGWPLSKEMWEYQLAPLVDAGFRVIKYDRRGFGKSDKPWTGYDYDTLAGDLKGLIDGLELNDVTLVGFSMGGGEVARYLTNYGDSKISKAVFVSSVTPGMLKSDENQDGVPNEKFEEMISGIKNDRIGFLDEFGKSFFGISMVNHPVSAPLLQYYLNLESHASAKATLDCLSSFAYTDFTEDVKKINIPTLIIHGSGDKTVPVDAAGRRMSKLLPSAKYIEYDGAAHGLFYTEKERLNQDLVDFISDSDDEDGSEKYLSNIAEIDASKS
ncbi:MAG: alpha/beta hydrolase [Bacteroidota bacterium]|nr:alpha/beta hydrolase [Bacteroidota bacterium]